MRYVVVTNAEGYKRRYLVRDTDGDDDALSGIPAGPPDLSVIDWHALQREINNRLADAGIFEFGDILNHPEGVNLIAAIVKQWVVAAMKSEQASKKAVLKKLK